MATIPLDSREVIPRRIVSVLPADGWWVLHKVRRADGSCYAFRYPVIGWALFEHGTELEPLIAGGGTATAVPTSEEFTDPTTLSVWRSGESWCECRLRPYEPGGSVDDLTWCPTCVGEIADTGW